MTKLQYYYSSELLNSFLSNFDCFSISVLIRWNYSFFFQADRRSSWLRLYRPWQWQSSSCRMIFSKPTAPIHITNELSQMTEIPLGMHSGMIRIEKFHTKTVSILLFLMFEKFQFCENYPFLTKVCVVEYDTWSCDCVLIIVFVKKFWTWILDEGVKHRHDKYHVGK